MEKLNELVDRYTVRCHCGFLDVIPKRDGHLVMHSDYIAMEQRAEAAEALNKHLDLAVRKAEGVSEALRRQVEAAESNYANEADARKQVEANYVRLEAKLAEQEKQQPFGKFEYLKDEDGDATDFIVESDSFSSESFPLYSRPAPAVNLASLVPDEIKIAITEGVPHGVVNGKVFNPHRADGWNACRAAILRNIDEAN